MTSNNSKVLRFWVQGKGGIRKTTWINKLVEKGTYISTRQEYELAYEYTDTNCMSSKSYGFNGYIFNFQESTQSPTKPEKFDEIIHVIYHQGRAPNDQMKIRVYDKYFEMWTGEIGGCKSNIGTNPTDQLNKLIELYGQNVKIEKNLKDKNSTNKMNSSKGTDNKILRFWVQGSGNTRKTTWINDLQKVTVTDQEVYIDCKKYKNCNFAARLNYKGFTIEFYESCVSPENHYEFNDIIYFVAGGEAPSSSNIRIRNDEMFTGIYPGSFVSSNPRLQLNFLIENYSQHAFERKTETPPKLEFSTDEYELYDIKRFIGVIEDLHNYNLILNDFIKDIIKTENDAVLSGGSVAMSVSKKFDNIPKDSDIDIFILNKNKTLFKKLFDAAIANLTDNSAIVLKANTVTFYDKNTSNYPFQFILTKAKTRAELVSEFDLGICQIIQDYNSSRTVHLATKNFLESIRTNTTTIHEHKHREKTMKRLAKYKLRFGLDNNVPDKYIQMEKERLLNYYYPHENDSFDKIKHELLLHYPELKNEHFKIYSKDNFDWDIISESLDHFNYYSSKYNDVLDQAIRCNDIKTTKKLLGRSKNPNVKPISDKLCDFMNIPHGSKVPKKIVVSNIEHYIREQELEDGSENDIFWPDEKLEKIIDKPISVGMRGYIYPINSIKDLIEKHFKEPEPKTTEEESGSDNGFELVESVA